MATKLKRDYGSLSDLELAGAVASRDPAAVRLLTERNNRRLFRAAWSILKDRDDAEDSVQTAYLRAFAGIADFAGRSSLSTWLTRIVINEALGRMRARARKRARVESDSVVFLDAYRDRLMRGSSTSGTAPDANVARGQIRELLEAAIAALPSQFRIVFVLRDVEGLSVDEVAEALDLVPGTVKTRHLRARRRLQEALAPELRSVLDGAFPFAGADCARLTRVILRRYCG